MIEAHGRMSRVGKAAIVIVTWAVSGALAGMYVPGSDAILFPMIVLFLGVGWIMR